MNTIGIHINKDRMEVEYKDTLGILLGICMYQIHYMSRESMRDWILQSCDLIEETFEWKKAGPIKTRITKIRKYLRDNFHNMNWDKMLTFYTNTLLSCNGLGMGRNG